MCLRKYVCMYLCMYEWMILFYIQGRNWIIFWSKDMEFKMWLAVQGWMEGDHCISIHAYIHTYIHIYTYRFEWIRLTKTNHIIELQKVLGIEAARLVIAQEIKYVLVHFIVRAYSVRYHTYIQLGFMYMHILQRSTFKHMLNNRIQIHHTYIHTQIHHNGVRYHGGSQASHLALWRHDLQRRNTRHHTIR